RLRESTRCCYAASVAVADRELLSFPTRRSSDLPDGDIGLEHDAEGQDRAADEHEEHAHPCGGRVPVARILDAVVVDRRAVQIVRSEEHTSELQSRFELVCRLLLEKKYYQSDEHV